MAFNIRDLLGGLSEDEDIGGLASLLMRNQNQNSPGTRGPIDPGMSMPQPQVQPQQEPVDDFPQGIQAESREPRKGMFGIKGTFRDILGTLGDALTEGSATPYATGRRQEKYSDALGDDFADDPTNAIDRLQRAGFGEEAQKLATQYREHQLKAQTAGTAQQLQQEKIIGARRENLNTLFATANDKNLPVLLEIARSRAEAAGIDPRMLPTTVEEAKRFGMDGYKANRLDQYDTAEERNSQNTSDMIRSRRVREGIAQQNADRPRNPPTRGASVVDAEILDKVRNGTATPSETKIYEERLRRASPKGSGRARSNPTSSDTSSGGTGKYVLRNGKFVKQ